MKIFFDNVNFNSRSGPNSFANRLASELHRLGHEITGPDNCDIHLSFIEQVCKKSEKSTMIQRLDGIWFKPEDYHEKNIGLKRTYDTADAVVWQTEFDKTMITKHWGEKKGSIIGNGMSLDRVSVSNENLKKIRDHFSTVFCCSANWHRQKRLQENILLFKKLQSTYSNSCLLVCGSNPDFVVSDPSILYLGNLPHETLMQVYSISDWMIHLAWLDHFPNTVVESIVHGTPVIHTNSGGTKEVVRGSGIQVKEIHEYQYELCDYEKPPELSLDLFILREVKTDSSHLCISKVAKNYINFFHETLRSKNG